MGIGTGLFERSALADAEAVLLVDDDKAETFKLCFAIDDRLSANDEVDVTSGEFLLRFFSLFGREAAAKECHAYFAASQKFFQRAQVLAGENFGRGHQRGLRTVGDGQQHGVDGDDGFAAADVALQQAVHRDGAGHVGGDFVDRLALRGGKWEGEQACDAGVDFRGGFQRRRLAAGFLQIAAQRHGEL